MRPQRADDFGFHPPLVQHLHSFCAVQGTNKCFHSYHLILLKTSLQLHACIFFFSFSRSGIMLGRMGPNGSALVNFCQSLNEAVLKIVAIVIW